MRFRLDAQDPGEYTLHIASHGIDPRVVEESLLSELGVTSFCTVTNCGFSLSIQSDHALMCEQDGTEPQRVRRMTAAEREAQRVLPYWVTTTSPDTAHFVATPGTLLDGAFFRAKGDRIMPSFQPALRRAGYRVRSYDDEDGIPVLVAISQPVLRGLVGCLGDSATYNMPGLAATVHDGADSVLAARRCAPEEAYFEQAPPPTKWSRTALDSASPQRVELITLMLKPFASVSMDGGQMRVVPQCASMMPIVRRMIRAATEVPEDRLSAAIAGCGSIGEG